MMMIAKDTNATKTRNANLFSVFYFRWMNVLQRRRICLHAIKIELE